MKVSAEQLASAAGVSATTAYRWQADPQSVSAKSRDLLEQARDDTDPSACLTELVEASKQADQLRKTMKELREDFDAIAPHIVFVLEIIRQSKGLGDDPRIAKAVDRLTSACDTTEKALQKGDV